MIAICAFLVSISYFLLTLAYRQAQASLLTSFEYTYLVWAMLIAYLMFDETPSLLTYLSALVIISCGFYIAWRERQKSHEASTIANVCG